jgi:nicotinate-nucleotide adenylyltransferase
MDRLGIFGGTFDPIHNGHIKALKTFIKALSLNKAFVIPTAVPPHKIFSGDTDEQSRLDMVRLAVEDIDNLRFIKSKSILSFI